MSRSHLLTGATGFVGGALALELLRRTDAELHCLVRPRAAYHDIQGRLEQSLIVAARLYGQADLIPEIRHRCQALPGDILEPHAGMSHIRRVDEVWHIAASLKFDAKHRDEIWSHNVDGTAHILDVARAARCEVFNYISTAYVAGQRQGLILEALPPYETPTNNAYEASKIVAEHRVAQSKLYTRIFRPSIVIGHSQTLAAPSFTGFYGVIQHVVTFNAKVARRLGLDLRQQSLRLRANPEMLANLIPVDRVVQDAVSISLADRLATAPSGRIYHLTNDHPPTMGLALRLLFDLLNLAPPHFVQNSDQLTALERRLDNKLLFHRAYMHHTKVFSRHHTTTLTGSGHNDCGLDQSELTRHIRWYLGVLSNPLPAATATPTAA